MLGARDAVSPLSATDLRQRHGQAYSAANCVIAAAGNLEHARLLEELARHGWFDEPANGGPRAAPAPAAVPTAGRGREGRDGQKTAPTHIRVATDTGPYAGRRK